MRILLSTILAASLLVGCGSCQNKKQDEKKSKSFEDYTSVQNKYAETITKAELKTALYKYASDEFEGRETGKPGQKLAINFIKDHYKEYGIPAAKKDGDYFQKVALEKLGLPTIDFKINDKIYKFKDDFISVIASKTGTLNASEIVYAGFGIEDEKYNDYANLDIKGKVVLIKSGEPRDTNGNFLLSGTKEQTKWSNFRQQFVLKRDAAKARGAKAVLCYYPEVYAMAALRFGVASGRMTINTDRSNAFYYMLVNNDLAKSIVKDIETNDKPRVVKSKVSLNYKTNTEPVDTENVAAFIKGSEKPNEIIVISAHLDHEGIKKGEVYNGADDDGSGTVAVLEIAQAFAKAKKDGYAPKRSILFLNVTGEEKGLLGSKYYTDIDPLFPLEYHIADLNIDMIGRTDPKREKKNRNYLYLIGSDKLSIELHNISEEMNKKYMNIDLDYRYNAENDPNRFYYRSDHYNFAKNNIPCIFYFNGTHKDYHQPGDTPDKIQYDLLENRTRLIFHTAWNLANRDNTIIADKAE